jgi:hypothetical protein
VRQRATGLTAAAMTALALAGGCSRSEAESGGGRRHPEPIATDKGRPPDASDASASGSAGRVSGSDAGNGEKAGSSTQSPGAKGAAASPGTTVPEAEKPPVPIEASLAAGCIKAGETQAITIRAPASAAVGYNSYYPDGKSGADAGDGFYGGNFGTVMPASGTWSDTWVVAANAPSGKVRVLVQGVHKDHSYAEKEVFFEVVSSGGRCRS